MTDAEDVLRDPGVDAVAIATLTATHYELARRALEAGKHVWVEKPLAPSYAEAMRLTELAHRRSLTLMVDHTFVYTGAVQAMCARIDTGELGELLCYDSVRVNLRLYQNDVNVIWGLASTMCQSSTTCCRSARSRCRRRACGTSGRATGSARARRT